MLSYIISLVCRILQLITNILIKTTSTTKFTPWVPLATPIPWCLPAKRKMERLLSTTFLITYPFGKCTNTCNNANCRLKLSDWSELTIQAGVVLILAYGGLILFLRMCHIRETSDSYILPSLYEQSQFSTSLPLEPYLYTCQWQFLSTYIGTTLAPQSALDQTARVADSAVESCFSIWAFLTSTSVTELTGHLHLIYVQVAQISVWHQTLVFGPFSVWNHSYLIQMLVFWFPTYLYTALTVSFTAYFCVLVSVPCQTVILGLR